uniref:Uncharacterized protein n=1 Tax=Cacopsylla melanoneura TaxID=428564 RepID=A0A8D8Q9N7_9HEMI
MQANRYRAAKMTIRTIEYVPSESHQTLKVCQTRKLTLHNPTCLSKPSLIVTGRLKLLLKKLSLFFCTTCPMTSGFRWLLVKAACCVPTFSIRRGGGIVFWVLGRYFMNFIII